MALFIKLSKSRGLIVIFMVLTICRFGSSPPLQKRSGNCSCSLSCAELPELKKNESVEVHVQNQSGKIYNEMHEVSSLFIDGHCSLVIPDCLQEDEKVQFRIYPIEGIRPIYEKMDLMPVCKTEKPPEESNQRTDRENKTHSVTEPPEDAEIADWVKVTISLLCVGLAIAGGFGGYFCWRKYQQLQNKI